MFLPSAQMINNEFNDTWLFEEPEGITIGKMNIKNIIHEWINAGYEPIDLNNGLKKIEGNQLVFYWYETSEILIAAEFEKKPQALISRAIEKYNKGLPPYASDLYDAVLNDRKNMSGNSIRIMSDDKLSNEGFEIWDRLLKKGHKISVYDANEPNEIIPINSSDDLLKYFKHNDNTYTRWQYILTEKSNYGETKAIFLTRRMRQLAGLSI